MSGNSISLNSQIKYISNGPLDAKAYIESKDGLSAFTSGEKYVGMTVVVSNAKTTKIPEEYWLVGGIGKNKWVKKTPNLQLKLDENGGLHLALEEGAFPASGTMVDIKQFVQEQTGDLFVDRGSVVTVDGEGNHGVFIKLEYSNDSHDAIYIDFSDFLSEGIHFDDYYTKVEADNRFMTLEEVAAEINLFLESYYTAEKIEQIIDAKLAEGIKIIDPENNAISGGTDGIGIFITGNDVEDFETT